MRKQYALGGELTQFNTGGLHSENPNGGIAIGQGASVEQGETKMATKNGQFIFSDRIQITPDVANTLNLPKSWVGKTMADYSKKLDSQFKDRNDNLSRTTKQKMLDRGAEVQETIKAQQQALIDAQNVNSEQAPEDMMNGQIPQGMKEYSDPRQMWNGGDVPQVDQFGNTITDPSTEIGTQSAGPGVGSYLGAATTAMDLGQTAFGKSQQDTSGMAASAPVNTGNMIGSGAMKGASAGMAFGPYGAAIGAVVGAGAGFLGSRQAKKDATLNSNNFAKNYNKQFSDQYALGGVIDPQLLPLRSHEEEAKRMADMERYKLLRASAIRKSPTSGYKPDLRSPEQSQMDYQYLRDSVKPGFNVDSGYRPNLIDPEVAQQQYLQTRQQLGTSMSLKKASQNNAQYALGGYGIDGRFIKPAIEDDSLPYVGSVPAIRAYQKTKGLPQVGLMGPKTTAAYALDKSNASPYTPVLDPSTPGQAPFVETTGERDRLEAAYLKANPQVEDQSKLGITNVGDKLGNALRYAPIAMDAYQLSQLKKPQGERLDRLGNRYKPTYTDLAAQQNIVNQELNNVSNAIQGSGASQGAIRSNLLGAQLNKSKALSQAYADAEARNAQQDALAQQFNLGVDSTNLQQSNTEKDINARNLGNYETQKSKLLGNIGTTAGEIGKEEKYKSMTKGMFGYDSNGKYVIDPEGKKVYVTPTSEKKALGGLIMKKYKK